MSRRWTRAINIYHENIIRMLRPHRRVQGAQPQPNFYSNPFVLSYCLPFFLTWTEKQWPTHRCALWYFVCREKWIAVDDDTIWLLLRAKDLDTISIIIFNRSHRTNVTSGCVSLAVIWYMFDWTRDIGPGPGRDAFNLFIQLHVLQPLSYSYIFNFFLFIWHSRSRFDEKKCMKEKSSREWAECAYGHHARQDASSEQQSYAR